MDEISFYRISDGRIWSISEAKFVDSYNEETTVNLRADGKPAGIEYLKRTLKFYGFTIGEELLTDEERAEAARKKRDTLLTATDYLLLPDYPLSTEKLEAVKTYRQALRDVPEQAGFPASIDWPTLELGEEA